MAGQLFRRCGRTLQGGILELRALLWERGIRTRIIAIALVPSLLITGLLSFLLLRQALAAAEQSTHAALLSATRHMAAAGQYALISGDGEWLQQIVNHERAGEGLKFACIQDSRASLRLCAGTPDPARLAALPPPGTLFRAPGIWLAAYPISLPEIESAHSLPGAPRSAAKPIGHAIAAIDTEPLLLSKRKVMLTMASLAVISAVLTAFLAWRLSTRLTRRIQHVSQAVDRIASGKLSMRVEASPGTELGILETGINRMAESLQTHQDELQVRILHATADLAARKEEAERANLAKSRFFASASHDLRQPLHALALFGEALKQHANSAELRKLARQIAGSIASLETLLNALLDVSRLEAGTIEVRRRHFPANQLFDRIQQQYEGPAAARGLRLRVRPSNWILFSDPVLLERILINLVSNAVRYTRSGRILVAGRRRGEALLIQVWDTGIGIPEQALETVFEEFVQLNNPERDREKGLGLGLAIVARTASLLGLKVTARSRVGHGSVFGVEVPLGATQHIAPDAPALPVAASLEGRLAVLVDDEVPILRAMESLFRSWGVALVSARSAEDALDQLSRLNAAPDFLITDYRLPGDTDGIAVARQFRKIHGSTLPVLVLTGDTAADTVQHIGAAGLKLMHKPVRPARLRAALAHLLDQEAAAR